MSSDVNSGRDERRQRPGDEDQDGGQRQRFPGDIAERAREDQQAEQDEEADLGDPAEALVEGDDRPPGRDPGAAEGEGGEVGGEQAGAVGDLGDPVGEGRDRDRRDRIDPVGREPDPGEGGDREAAEGDADDDPDAEFERLEADHVGDPEARHLDPFDEPDHEQQRDRVVHPGLALERAGERLLERRAAQHGEDRGRVGGGDGGAGQHPFEGPEAEDPLRRQPGDDRGDHRADGRQRCRGSQHRADLRPAGGEAALEQDQDEGDRPQGARELGVVEVDPADPLRAGEHPEPEEQQQAGDPDPVGEERPDDAGGEEGAGDEDQLGVMLSHRNYAPSSAAARRVSSSSVDPASGTSSARSCGRR